MILHIISHFIFFGRVEGIECLVVDRKYWIQCLEGIQCLVVDHALLQKMYKRCCALKQQSVVTELKKGEHLISRI